MSNSGSLNKEPIKKKQSAVQPCSDALQGIRILVTRPAHQAQQLCDMLAQYGAQPMRLPVIEILVNELQTQAKARLQTLANTSLAIFISPNAVQYGLAALLAQGKIPDTLKLATIGKASAEKMLQILGRLPDIYPQEQYNSEALLALEALSAKQMKGSSVIIFRGEGGRELLAKTLLQRGAKVDYIEVYRRQRPQIEAQCLNGLFGINQEPSEKKPDIISLTSNEGLDNLQALVNELPLEQRVGALQRLWQTPLIVVTTKMRDNARQMGFQSQIIVASKTSNRALLESAVEWARIR